ncbi:hypothetical protein MTP10_19785 [Nonomuraea sp. 3-1Str]|uniref:hypothetical protein n=1 Tax=Nonomuraea sp. 3-1Str TaxID=2929801 RepID=UPI00285BA04B|nr:hypothetical protein [Nonomuraea sp. 3-1Str]MDR8410964.1 hypothetical protein [Nonomuraea sp. 3-1Str]
MIVWEPHIPRGRTRITETCCCAAYEWAAEGGSFLVLRRAARLKDERRPVQPRYEEAGRGRYAAARAVWAQLVEQHRRNHEAR